MRGVALAIKEPRPPTVADAIDEELPPPAPTS